MESRYPIVRELLTRVGVYVPPGAIHYANIVLNHLHVGRWLHDRGLRVPMRFAERENLYAALASTIAEPASYLEFGVFEGASLRCWSTLLRHPDTTFDGFDSFEGLPENWNLYSSKKSFDLGGRMPSFDDPRVRLHKGWFADTLPDFVRTCVPKRSLVIHLDADLYSSTIFVLKQVRPLLVPGAILIFDEFSHREHETKALTEFIEDAKIRLDCVGATRTLAQVAFAVMGRPGDAIVPSPLAGEGGARREAPGG